MSGSNDLERNKLIMAWIEAKKNLDVVKKHEKQLRDRILNTLFPVANRRKGTNTYNLGKGFALKAVFKDNIKIDEEILETILDTSPLNSENALSDCFTYKHSLEKDAYELLSNDFKVALRDALTFEPASPTLKFDDPRVKEQ